MCVLNDFAPQMGGSQGPQDSDRAMLAYADGRIPGDWTVRAQSRISLPPDRQFNVSKDVHHDRVTDGGGGMTTDPGPNVPWRIMGETFRCVVFHSWC